MTTYLELQTKIARALRDEANQTFSVTMVKDMIDASVAEISDIAPERFQEDITPTADTLAYQVRADVFVEPNDDIEVQKVELWDQTQTPAMPWKFVEPASAHPTGLSYSQAGWRLWAGMLELPNRVVDLITVGTHSIRVWGYSPWAPMTEDDDVVPFGPKLVEAVILLCRIESLRALIGSRVLFTQWQTRSNNTDVTMGSLASDMNLAMEEWRRKSQRLRVLREAP